MQKMKKKRDKIPDWVNEVGKLSSHWMKMAKMRSVWFYKVDMCFFLCVISIQNDMFYTVSVLRTAANEWQIVTKLK